MKQLFILLVVLGALIGGFFAFNAYVYEEKQATTGVDPKNTEYIIEGQRVKLVDGEASVEAAPDAASKVVTRYFGNEMTTDLNDDGREDVVFLLTQQTGGSGTFFYVVAALNTERGYVGSMGFLLGDRIAPQTTELSRNPAHRNVIVVNYADRALGEPMTAQPSVGKSVWLKLDAQSMQFGEVAQNFEGEADPSRMRLDMTKWRWISVQYEDGRVVKPKVEGSFTLSFDKAGRFSVSTDCNSMGGAYSAAEGTLVFTDTVSTLMFCEGSQEGVFAELLRDTARYHFTSRGELILSLKYDSGTVTFR